MRRIAVIVGSRSDLPQCKTGLEVLQAARERGQIQGQIAAVRVWVSSIHRNTREVIDRLNTLPSIHPPCDVIITAAGWANALTGIVDSYLRYALGDARIVVVGVALEDPGNVRHTQAAELSITEVPKTQVVYRDARGIFLGADGFRRACEFAVSGELPKITLPEPPRAEDITLSEAIEIARAAG